MTPTQITEREFNDNHTLLEAYKELVEWSQSVRELRELLHRHPLNPPTKFDQEKLDMAIHFFKK